MIYYIGPCCFLLCCFSPSPTLFPVAFAFIPSLLCGASLEENFTPTSSTINSLPSFNSTLLFANVHHYFFIDFFFFFLTYSPFWLFSIFNTLLLKSSLFPPFCLVRPQIFKRLDFMYYLFCMICLPSSSLTFF